MLCYAMLAMLCYAMLCSRTSATSTDRASPLFRSLPSPVGTSQRSVLVSTFLLGRDAALPGKARLPAQRAIVDRQTQRARVRLAVAAVLGGAHTQVQARYPRGGRRRQLGDRLPYWERCPGGRHTPMGKVPRRTPRPYGKGAQEDARPYEEGAQDAPPLGGSRVSTGSRTRR